MRTDTGGQGVDWGESGGACLRTGEEHDGEVRYLTDSAIHRLEEGRPADSPRTHTRTHIAQNSSVFAHTPERRERVERSWAVARDAMLPKLPATPLLQQAATRCGQAGCSQDALHSGSVPFPFSCWSIVWSVESFPAAAPSGPAVELGRGVVQGALAAGADEGALALLVVQRAVD